MVIMKKKIPNADLDTLVPILIGVWRRYRQIFGPADVLQTREFRAVVQSLQALRKGLFEDKSLFGTHYFSQPELLGAYLLYYWVIHYQEGLSLINEVPTTPKRVLDLCSGPSPFAFAALKHGATDVISFDLNAKALELGAEIAGRYGFPLTVRQGNCLDRKMDEMGKFDLIILGHCLEELFPENRAGYKDAQNAFIMSLFKKMEKTGFLLIVDQSELHSNHRLLTLRDSLVKQGVPIQAPCVFKGECPALKTAKSPCYAQRMLEKPYLIKELQRAASINLSSTKMSYVIFRHPEAQWPKLEEKSFFRVISPFFENQQGKHVYLCGQNGKEILFSDQKQHEESTKPFDFLKRGELISTENMLIKGNTQIVMKDSLIQVQAACGKPLREDVTNDDLGK